jgi:hypothetical protein
MVPNQADVVAEHATVEGRNDGRVGERFSAISSVALED